MTLVDRLKFIGVLIPKIMYRKSKIHFTCGTINGTKIVLHRAIEPIVENAIKRRMMTCYRKIMVRYLDTRCSFDRNYNTFKVLDTVFKLRQRWPARTIHGTYNLRQRGSALLWSIKRKNVVSSP